MCFIFHHNHFLRTISPSQQLGSPLAYNNISAARSNIHVNFNAMRRDDIHVTLSNQQLIQNRIVCWKAPLSNLNINKKVRFYHLLNFAI